MAKSLPASVAALLLLAACQVPVPPRPMATTTVTAPPALMLNVELHTNAAEYAGPEPTIHMTFVNNDTQPVYLGICGPWEIIHPGDPTRPAWDIACEIDYLGYRIEPGGTLTGTVTAQLRPGEYQAHVRAYGDCALGEPQIINARETYYGEFGACSTRQDTLSQPFQVH